MFDAMGQRTYRVGAEPRRANIAKIAGNLMVACAIEALAEAAALLHKDVSATAGAEMVRTDRLVAQERDPPRAV
jgi:3-hydroxyisobutyrate dehydrogenase-like beta-hydroxyacid dehydrogenase